MTIKIKDKEIETEKIKNIYPSAIIRTEDGSTTPISIEWAEQNKDKIKIDSYAILVVKKDNTKIDIYFDDFNEMVNALKSIFDKFKK
ncbi:hypothetical protein [Nitrosophilus kaiyonis]|uniref:hypothetical protein n=1 Tax=Nitrosophilus kaiyonis TaxID=2930200 RepID=UPI002492A3F8|nr:hypothetical protein [Nitrosophilus kaiyonis]